MSAPNQRPIIDYGFTQALQQVFPTPIVAKRAPTTADKAQLGTLWVQPVNTSGTAVNSAWVLTSIISNSATWSDISGGAGSFTTLTVNPGPTNLSTSGNGAVSIGNSSNTGAITLTVGSGNMSVVGAGHTITIGNDAAANLVTVGSSTAGALTTLVGGNGTGVGSAAVELVTADAGDIQVGSSTQTGAVYIRPSTAGGNTNIATGVNTASQVVNIATGAAGASSTVNILTGVATAGTQSVNIATGASAKAVVIGNTTASTTVALNTPSGTAVVAANGLTATAGNITASNGNVVLSTAASFVQLPGPIKIMSGAGAPANGLAAEAGDLYIRTDPAGATSRIYVATAANTWTNVTCAA